MLLNRLERFALREIPDGAMAANLRLKIAAWKFKRAAAQVFNPIILKVYEGIQWTLDIPGRLVLRSVLGKEPNGSSQNNGHDHVHH